MSQLGISTISIFDSKIAPDRAIPVFVNGLLYYIKILPSGTWEWLREKSGYVPKRIDSIHIMIDQNTFMGFQVFGDDEWVPAPTT